MTLSLRDIQAVPGGEELTQMGYEFYPQGLEHVIRRVHESFAGQLMVTENGIATSDDTRRVAYIGEALEGVRACVDSGIDVAGYLYWSLIDNYEWQSGYSMQFGLMGREDRLPQGARWASLPDCYYPNQVAVDGYHRIFEDIDLMAQMGFTCYRMSICWSRLFPKGTEHVPIRAGVEYYRRVFECLRAHNIEPVVTLLYFDTPLGLDRPGEHGHG